MMSHQVTGTAWAKGEAMNVEQAQELLGQIGRMNLLAVSGGRHSLDAVGALRMPVMHGYAVRVILDEGSDTYTVQRTYTRGVKTWVKGERTYIYCDEIAEQVYRAACYHDEWGNVPASV
jgi:hypothetical protein